MARVVSLEAHRARRLVQHRAEARRADEAEERGGVVGRVDDDGMIVIVTPERLVTLTPAAARTWASNLLELAESADRRRT